VSAPLDPPGPALAAKNRRLLAGRKDWPQGAVEACEAIEAQHPDWFPMWSAGGEASRPDTGYYAQRRHGEQLAYGKTPWDLCLDIESHPPPGWPPFNPVGGNRPDRTTR
jgi:hypothetical protein